MANPIPPLFSSTPPPIDDLEDVSQIDDSADIDFGEYETNTDAEFGSFEGPSLPNTPRHAVKDDTNTYSIPNNCYNSNTEQEHRPQVNEFEKIEAVPKISSDEEVISDVTKSLEEPIRIEENYSNINIEIQNINEDNTEEKCDNLFNNFVNEPEKLESPPSLELTFQIVSDENDSFEKLSNNERELDKESCENSLESNSESLSKETEPSTNIVKEPLKAIDFEYENYATNETKDVINDPDNVTDTDNLDSSLFPSFEIPEETIECGNELTKIDTDDDVLDVDAIENNPAIGCDIEKIKIVEDNYFPERKLHFEADFSQLGNSLSSDISNKSKENSSVIQTSKPVTVEEITNSEDFDSFQDFKQASNDIFLNNEENIEDDLSHNVVGGLSISNNELLSNIENDSNQKVFEEDDDDFDDEFGDFSDFKEASIFPTANALTFDQTNNQNIEKLQNNQPNINDRFMLILNAMFPISETCDINRDKEIDNTIGDLTQDHFINTNLNHIDSANALDYQWTNSNTRHSLIKSLGIDSRNILYGEKWNCSMPRFASNLGFTPLEPLKPVKVDSIIQQHTNLVTSNNSITTNPVTKNILVPEAEFDWNSSGLVNPLDGGKKRSEEKSNLEIHSTTNDLSEINSSNKSSKIKDEPIETNVSTKYESRTTTISNDTEFFGGISNSHNENLSIESTSTAAATTTSTTTTAITKKPEFSNEDNDTTKLQNNTPNDTELSTISKPTPTSFGAEKSSIVDISLEGVNSIDDTILLTATNIQTNQYSINENRNDNYLKQHVNFQNDYINMGTTPTTFVVPLKETHIFTPTKSENPISQSTGGSNFITSCNIKPIVPIPSSSNVDTTSDVIMNSIDFDYETAAAGTIINEKVIKKEYHDVEYDPTKFGLKPLHSNSTENEEISSFQIRNKDLKINNDISCLETNDINSRTNYNRSNSWTFHLNNLNDDVKSVNIDINKPEPLDSDINSTNRTDPIPFIFGSNELNDNNRTGDLNSDDSNHSVLPNDLIISNDLNQKYIVDSKNIEKTETFENKSNSGVCSLSKSNCSSFDDEFTEFQSVLPIPEHKNITVPNTNSSPSNSFKMKHEKLLESSPVSVNKQIKENSSRNQTPTLSSDDRMILSPAILLPKAVSVNQTAASSNQTPKIDWPEPGINSDELARLESIFPQAKSANSAVINNVSNLEPKDNPIACSNDDDWSDFISVPPVSQNNSPHQQSSRVVNNASNLNIIYNPQSPTKVSTQRTTNHHHKQQLHNHLNKSNDEDEWSDFVSSAPISSTATGSGNNFIQISNHHHAIHGGPNQSNNYQLKNSSKMNNSQQQFLHGEHKLTFNNSNTFVPSQQGFLNNNNNKISQYLLSNSSAGNTDNHINNGSNNMQLNSLKPTDFIPHHHIQHQLLQKQQKILSQSTTNSGGNNISFIPDLGFSAPQNQFINLTKKNYQRK